MGDGAQLVKLSFFQLLIKHERSVEKQKSFPTIKNKMISPLEAMELTSYIVGADGGPKKDGANIREGETWGPDTPSKTQKS